MKKYILMEESCQAVCHWFRARVLHNETCQCRDLSAVTWGRGQESVNTTKESDGRCFSVPLGFC